ncbi:MAG: DUF2847 family protein [Meiothermus sp.]|nr:DUF2847 family protein [Meiothermus sp.]
MSLRERSFQLTSPEAVNHFLQQYLYAAVFKASTTDKTVEAYGYVEKYLLPRPDVAVGMIRIPEDRPASDRVEELTGIRHHSPQFILFHKAKPLFDLDNFKINPDNLEPLLAQHLPPEVGQPVQNPEVVSLKPYANLLDRFLEGELSEERFQWGYLDLLRKEAGWRSERDFGLLDSLFPNPDGRGLKPATVVALEFQAQLAGKGTPLLERARELRSRI